MYLKKLIHVRKNKVIKDNLKSQFEPLLDKKFKNTSFNEYYANKTKIYLYTSQILLQKKKKI